MLRAQDSPRDHIACQRHFESNARNLKRCLFENIRTEMAGLGGRLPSSQKMLRIFSMDDFKTLYSVLPLSFWWWIWFLMNV